MQNIPTRLGFQGNPNGRVTGSIASILSTAHGIVSFDLGEAWDLYALVQITLYPVGPMGALNTVIVYGADSAGDTTVPSRILGIPGSATAGQAKLTNLAPATGAQTIWVRPMGRFVVVDFQNNDGTNASGAASTISFAAYAGA